MIHEYAIEPDALVSWATNKRDTRYLFENFGLGKTRVMAEFPKFKNWKKQVYIAAGNSLDDFSKKRLVDLLNCLSENKVARSDCKYDGKYGWLENAEEEYGRHQFTAILASKNTNNRKYILLNTDIGDWPEELWEIKDKIIVQRQSHAMAEVLSPLLLKSSDIIFIDPYFRANRKDFRDLLHIFLQEAVRYPVFSKKQRVEVHVSADYEKVLSHDAFFNECQRELPQLIPAGLSVIFKRWTQKQGNEKLHNRYILTDLGGVSFGAGLNTGEKGETDDLALLNRDQYMRRWQQYAGEDSEFELKHKFVIIGEN